MNNRWTMVLAMTLLITAGCESPSRKEAADRSELAAKIRRFAPIRIGADRSNLPVEERRALEKLLAAARIMDTLYLRQLWDGNEALLRRLEADRSPGGGDRLRYFLINMGPWSQLDDNEAFLPGVPARKLPQANFYPADMTKEEFNRWVSGLSDEAQKDAAGFFTVIRRDPGRQLRAVPYSEEYAGLLRGAAQLLRDAAGLTRNSSLKRFLTLRAEAFLSNRYAESDIAWLELDGPIDVTIGPYEVYADELFNYKASFEAFIGLRNDSETQKLALFSRHLQEIEDALPIAQRFKNPRLGALAPIRVVDQIAVGGEARAGVQTAAFNLPNDEQIRAEKGSKRVMLRNVQEAKFSTILKPIAGIAIDPSQQPLISFEPFFTHILAHELMHGLGPQNITVNGKATTVRQAMKEIGSALEEAKADIAGLFALKHLIDRGILPKEMEQRMYGTYLAGIFRSVRFGISEAHGRGMALQYSWLMEQKAIVHDERTGTFSVNLATMPAAVRELTGLIMTIQGEGNYKRAHELLTRYAAVDPPLRRTLEKLTSIPVDIAPLETIEEE